MTTKEAFEKIRQGMARAFFASAYADQADECGQPLTGEIMDQLPAAIDPAAIHAADTLIRDMINANGLSDAQRIGLLYLAVEQCDRSDSDRECTPELFGHYCAMQAMGHGVGLESFGSAARDRVTVPYCEFGSHSLQLDYFQEPDR